MNNWARAAGVVAVLLAAFPAMVCAQTPNFQGLGDLPGGGWNSTAYGMSPDGSVVVGDSLSSSGKEAFRWTAADGIEGLGDLPGGDFKSRAGDASNSGSVVVGTSYISESSKEGFRWTPTGSIEGVGDLPGGDYRSGMSAVSADGSILAGDASPSGNTEAVRWTETGGFERLGVMSGGTFSQVFDMSSDGSTVVGQGNHVVTGRDEAFRWTQQTGMVGLGDLTGGAIWSIAYGVSPTGSVVVGRSESALGLEAFRWTLTDPATGAGTMSNLGDLSGGTFGSNAMDVSAEGSVVVGWGTSGIGQEAFIWDAVNGMRNLQDVLVNDFGIDMTDWTLTAAMAVSDDGLTIVGYGTNPLGNQEAWIATIPEPATLSLLALGGLALIRRWNRKGAER